MGLINYVRETRGELKHVTWPSRQQAVLYTVMVIVVSLFVAAFLGLFDFLFQKVIQYFIA
jgi:preprotein translocase subunit SecE